MLEATQRKKPLSVLRTPVICSTPLGSSVYLHKVQVKYCEGHVKDMYYIHVNMCETHLGSSMLSGCWSLCHVMLASGIPFT